MYNWSTNKQHTHSNKGVSVANSIHHSKHIYNYLKALNLGLFYPMCIWTTYWPSSCLFFSGDTGENSWFPRSQPLPQDNDRLFPESRKWKDDALQDVLKSSILQAIYREAQRSGQPIYCIVDDTIASHTRPSSQAVHPIEAAYFHQSHLKGCQDYGHQVVSVMLSCNGITLNYAVILYDKSRSKIQIVQEIAEELPAAPVISYFLCDSWYTTAKVMDRFIRKGFYTVGALKTNRILYPCGIRQKPVHLPFICGKQTRMSASWPLAAVNSMYTAMKGSWMAFQMQRWSSAIRRMDLGIPKHCVYFSLQMQSYPRRRSWTPIRNGGRLNYFPAEQSKLALDSYQIRSRQGIQRYWLIMSLVHYLCCMHSGNYCTFEEGYASLKQQLKQEQFANLYRLIKSSASFEEAFKFVG